MSESLAIPAIHNNGTSKEELVNNLKEAYLSLKESLNKLHNTGPHPRDYYVKQYDDYNAAKVQYRNRCNKINEVMNELEQIAIAIQTKDNNNVNSTTL